VLFGHVEDAFGADGDVAHGPHAGQEHRAGLAQRAVAEPVPRHPIGELAGDEDLTGGRHGEPGRRRGRRDARDLVQAGVERHERALPAQNADVRGAMGRGCGNGNSPYDVRVRAQRDVRRGNAREVRGGPRLRLPRAKLGERLGGVGGRATVDEGGAARGGEPLGRRAVTGGLGIANRRGADADRGGRRRLALASGNARRRARYARHSPGKQRACGPSPSTTSHLRRRRPSLPCRCCRHDCRLEGSDYAPKPLRRSRRRPGR